MRGNEQSVKQYKKIADKQAQGKKIMCNIFMQILRF